MESKIKILIACGAFKGHLTSDQVNESISEGFSKKYFSVHKVPLADGGDGTLEIFSQNFQGEYISLRVNNPDGLSIRAPYFRMGKTAVIELAKASGLGVVNGKNKALLASTYGTGQLIVHAIKNGCTKVILCVGGSATTDCATGILAALGARFLDKKGNAFQPKGGQDLLEIESIDFSGLIDGKVLFECLCDGRSTIGGENGPWSWSNTKGATRQESLILKRGILHFIDIVERQSRKSIAFLPGGGCGGGVPAGLYAFLRTKVLYGPRVTFPLTDFDRYLKDSDIVITGEGTFDMRTFEGKLVSFVLERCLYYRKPCIVVTGKNLVRSSEWKDLGILSVFETKEDNLSFEDIRTKGLGPKFLTEVGTNIAQFIEGNNSLFQSLRAQKLSMHQSRLACAQV